MLLLPPVVPSFNGDGYLPNGVYPCSEAGLFFHFVGFYPDSTTRQTIFDCFVNWRMDVQPLIEAVTQWVDGSFVTSKQDPADIDVVTFCDIDYYNAASEETRNEIDRLLDGQSSTKEGYLTHSFLVLSAPPGHPRHADSELWRKYHQKYWARTYEIDPISGRRVRTDQKKGFVVMTLGEISCAPFIPTEGVE